MMPDTAPVVAIPPDADPMESLLREAERRAHQRGWDAGNSYQPLIWTSVGEITGLFVVQRPDPPYSVRYAHPAQVMRVMAGFYAGRGAACLPPDLAGWLICCEAWMIPDGGPADRADALAGRVHTRPDRVETRLVIARLANGDEGHLMRVRGVAGQPDEVVFSHERADGAVGDALRELVVACAGQTGGRR